jgi:hypothetical protein
MRKLRLELEDLQVTSFPTAVPVLTEGTVVACNDEDVPAIPSEFEELATGTPCMWSAGCPPNSFSCFCMTGALPPL